jgi:Phage phiEco32-like COOH.NH2 ligase-type 2
MLVNGKEYTIGADPEVFVGRKGSFVSAHGLVSGTKKEPTPVKKGAVQVDGLALEYNIDAASSFEEFESNITTVQEQLKSMIGDLEFLNTVSVHFEKEFLNDIPFENLMLGCEPDFNAYTGQPNPRPDGGKLMRTAGGHVHIGGFFNNNPMHPMQMGMSACLSRFLDRELGIYSILWDKDDNRRSMYGQAGCFRPKPYGMEYRSMSNAWTFNNKLMRFVYDGVERALKRMFDAKEYLEEVYENSEIQSIINNSDRNSDFFKNNPYAEEVYSIVGA